MLHVAQSVKDPPLLGSQSLPKYEFVQDIEEIPDISIEDTLKNSKAFIMNPVDSFWFFELDTPKTDKKILDLSHLGATATVETSRTSSSKTSPYISNPGSSLDILEEMPQDAPPIRAPGTFQLYMPDPEMMDRLGEIQGGPSVPTPKIPSPRSKSVQNPKTLQETGPADEVKQQENNEDLPNLLTVPGSNPNSVNIEDSRGRRSRSGSTKRVTIADPPVAGSQSPPRSPAGSTGSNSRSRQTRIVSYQKPRYDRSKSRNTRIKEAISKPVNPAYSDRKTMENLSASMRSASELLERRRAQGSTGSRYVDQTLLYPATPSRVYPGVEPQSSVDRRGRASARYIPSDQGSNPNSYRSNPSTTSHGDHSTDRTTGPGGGSLWGLLDMAQSWIMKPAKSRRDRSEEQSRSLLRKSRNLNP